MAATKIRGSQITDGTVANAQISGSAAIASSKLADGANFANIADRETNEVPTGDIDGANVEFTLANTPVAGTVQVFLNGILQQVGGGNDYTISGDTITFNTAPQTNDVLLVTYWQ